MIKTMELFLFWFSFIANNKNTNKQTIKSLYLLEVWHKFCFVIVERIQL